MPTPASADRMPDYAGDLPHKIAAIVAQLGERGVAATAALEGTGLATDDLALASQRVSLRQLLRVCENAVRLAPEPGLGIRAGRRLSVVHFGMYGYALLSCADAQEAIAFALKYRPLTVALTGLAFDTRNGVSGWVFHDIHGLGEDSAVYRFAVEFQAGMLISIQQDIFGAPLVLREACLRGAGDEAAYSALLGCPVRFGQAENALRFEPGTGNRPVIYANEHAREAIRQTSDQLLAEVPAAQANGALQSVVHVVRARLLRDPGRFPSLETVAGELHMTSRTLRRKLLAYGTSFQELQGELRRQLTMDYLLRTEMTAEDIAIAVGFNDAAALRRAFHRWTGTSPGAWRREQAPGGA